MSHFFTVVIVPGTTPTNQIEETVSRLLAPYDENQRVEPYKVYLDREDIARMAARYDIAPDNLAELAHYITRWTGLQGGMDEHGLYRLSTYNPEAKWDWWVIGGRWNGEIRGAPRNDETGFNFGAEYHQLAENLLPVSQLEHRLTCFAVVTPDGSWHERGHMGMWAIVTGEKEQDAWDKEVMALLQQHQGDLLVGVDCHI
jgi:hypothetical protein